MKRIIIIMCGLVLVSAVFANNEKVSFNSLQIITNSKGAPVYNLNGKPFTGKTYDEYGSNQIYREVVISNGLIQKQTGWYITGEKESEFSYQNGLLHGKSVIYHRGGNVYQEVYYWNGMSQGKQYRYNCDGSLQAQWDSIGNVGLMRLEFEKKNCTANCQLMLDGC